MALVGYGLIFSALMAGVLSARPAVADETPPSEAVSGLMGYLAQHGQHDLVNETWNLYGQYTYIRTWKPAFQAPYTNANGTHNSLKPEAEQSFSQTLTLFAGLKVWSGGEIYFVPEVVTEATLSDLKGIGGALENFELQKSGGPAPSFYRSRLFLRQTFELGGEKVDLPSAQMQLGQKVDGRRLVFSLGNFSQLDVLDRNNVVGDLRRSFFDGTFMTYAAYDYPSDARGYSMGVAAELDWDQWAVRFTRLMPPKHPDEQALDSRFFLYYGDSLEVEHDHAWNGQPGAIRVLAYRYHVISGRFSDAMDAYKADPSKSADNCDERYNFDSDNAAGPDLCWVRTPGVKMGIGLNLEQNLNADVGLFLRAMYSDGQREVYSYDSADRSVAGGVLIKGTGWRRPQDSVGLGGAVSWISDSHAQFLASGGVDAFVGDGHLRRASEDLAEVFYSLNLLSALWISADYQRLWNPAFNAERGPVNFYGGRLHAEF